MVPAIVRTAPEPTPKVARRRQRRLNQLGMVGQPQVVVAGQVDHFAPVIVAYRRLLVIENAELEMRPVRAQFIQHGSQVGKLRARSSLCHGIYLNQKG